VNECGIWLLTWDDLYAIGVLILSMVVAVLAATRVTRLLVEDQLTSPYRRWVVARWGPLSWQSDLVHCPWCTGMWVSMAMMPPAVIWPNIWVVAAYSVPAASMIIGIIHQLLDRKE
jgi:hypothetical protein